MEWRQNVIVMRHGDRIDHLHLQPPWVDNADRPWDPPLVDAGKTLAWTTGKKLRTVGFPIHRVFVSPFFRCLQTAAEVVTALCAVQDDAALMTVNTSHAVQIDPSKLKVSIEYGLCEILGREAIPLNLAPKDGKWFPDVSELEAVFPDGTIDHSVERIYKKMPDWEESLADARNRYKNVVVALADMFPHENLLFVTHGQGVAVSESAFLMDVQNFVYEYCAYSHLQRQFSLTNFNVVEVGAKTGSSSIPQSKEPTVT